MFAKLGNVDLQNEALTFLGHQMPEDFLAQLPHQIVFGLLDFGDVVHVELGPNQVELVDPVVGAKEAPVIALSVVAEEVFLRLVEFYFVPVNQKFTEIIYFAFTQRRDPLRVKVFGGRFVQGLLSLRKLILISRLVNRLIKVVKHNLA